MTNTSSSPPPVLRPPADDGDDKRVGSNTPVMLFIGISLFLLLVIAGMVIWVLPQRDPSLPVASPSQPSEQGPEKDQALHAQEQKARALLKQWLSVRVRAEADRVARWGNSAYENITETAAGANAAMQARSFEQAGNLYAAATEELEKLMARKETMLEAALQEGTQALEQNRSLAAADAFQRALAIDPDNAQARRGAERAAVRDEVRALLEQALQKERDGDYPAALDLVDTLLELDGEFGPGLEARKRITDTVENRVFQEGMTAFLAAMEDNNLTDARTAYEKAKQLRSNDPIVAQAGKRLAEAEQAHALQRLRSKAERLSMNERWSDALQAYHAALTIAPQATFAVNGRQKAEKRFELDTVLESILAHPDRLQEDGPLKEARQALECAMAVPAPGPRLQGQIDRLAELLHAATTPVSVTITSDSKTEVMLYRVARLGRFFTKQLMLRPGTYTLVGSREGYRDERITFDVDPQQTEMNVAIRCKEQI